MRHDGGGRLMTRRTLAVALAAALCGLIVAPALAQNAPARPQAQAHEARSRRRRRARPHVTVMVTNSRKADLVQLQATESGSVSWKKVLGALKSGNHAPAQLPASLQLPGRPARNLQRRPVDGCVRRRRLRAKDAEPDGLKRTPSGSRPEGAGRSLLLAEQLGDIFPIDEVIDPRLQIVGPAIAIVDVVGVLPHVDAEDRLRAVDERVLAVRRSSST